MRWNKSLLLIALPGILGFGLFYIIPFIFSIILSFTDHKMSFVGLSNYYDVLHSEPFLLAVKNTAVFVFLSVGLNCILPLFLSLFINSFGSGIKKYIIPVCLLPFVLPTGSTIFFWRAIFSYNGIINSYFLAQNPINWLESQYSLITVLVIFMWSNMGFNIVIYIMGLSLIPRDYYDIAKTEGAGFFYMLRKITIVYLRPVFFIVIIISFVNSFKVFKVVYQLSGSYPSKPVYLLQHYMNNQFFSFDYQKLSVTSILLFAFLAALFMGVKSWLK